MCGIAGLWQFDGAPVDRSVLQAMTDALAHRGPDGEGLYLDGSLGLGHRRLAILDLGPTGHQPMSYGDGRFWITYNGEVYNFLELQHELGALGRRFRSSSDTEIILAAYAQWGQDCLRRFNGMWAFAIWDAQEKTLFLARDRFGIKPLFYLLERDRFAFASEWKALLPLPGFVRRVDWSTFVTALLDPYCQEGIETCLLLGIRRLLPGHCMTVTAGEVKVYRWWNTLDHLVTSPSTLAGQAERFRELFADACCLRMRSDVPIGTCLSGGLDSSAIVCMLADIARRGGEKAERLAEDWQWAFIVTFPDTPVDERGYADMVVKQTGVRPIYITPTPADLERHIHDVVYHVEGLDAGLLIQLWALYREVRNGDVVVTLDGHGGDELLGGYVSHVLHALHDAGQLRRWPGRYLQLLDTYRAMFRNSSGAMQPDRPLRRLVVETNAWAAIATRRGLLPADHTPRAPGVARFLRPEALALARTPDPPYVWPGDGHLGAALYREFHQTMLPTILRNFDRLSMAHGVEVRMPFMDWRLVTYVFSLPPESKIGRGYTKLVLREAMAGLLPEPVRTRRDKIGFAPPLAQWFQGDLRAWLWDKMLTDESIAELVDTKAIAGFFEQTERDGALSWNRISGVWPLVHSCFWLECFTNDARGPLPTSTVIREG